MNRDMLGHRSLRRGFRVVFAVDGQEALDVAKSETPDIVLIDLRLRDLDGYEATRQLEANEADMPIVAVTANATIADRDQAIAGGCDSYETKPINFTNLRGKIDRLLAERDQLALTLSSSTS